MLHFEKNLGATLVAPVGLHRIAGLLALVAPIRFPAGLLLGPAHSPLTGLAV